MLKNEREREIIQYLKEKDGFGATKELCKALFASESSIRRDLAVLEKRGIVKRTYGGCELVTNYSGSIAFSDRAHHNVEAKKIIAKKASELIRDGDVIFLDQSSSAYYLAERIAQNSSLVVVTNNIEILSLLSSSKMKVISSGGSLCAGNRSCLVGSEAEKCFEEIFADILFFSTKSVTDDGIISDCSREEVAVRKRMLKNARKKVYLCDSEKIGTLCAYKQCELSEVDAVVSERDEIEIFRNKFENLNIK